MRHSKKGFASLTPEQRKAIARQGGLAATARGVAHKFTPEEARKAGHLSGSKYSKEYLAELGRKGGLAKQRKILEAKQGKNNGS